MAAASATSIHLGPAFGTCLGQRCSAEESCSWSTSLCIAAVISNVIFAITDFFFCLSFYVTLIAEQLDTASLLGGPVILFLSQQWSWGTIMAFILGLFASVKAVLPNIGLFWQGKSSPNHWSSRKACEIKPSGSFLTEQLQFSRSPVHNGLLVCG